VHDSERIDGLIKEDDLVVDAESGYKTPQNKAALADKKVAAQIDKNGASHYPLTEEQRASNREKSRIRSRVEHVFAQISGSKKALYATLHRHGKRHCVPDAHQCPLQHAAL
jgi:IS5 family transposase